MKEQLTVNDLCGSFPHDLKVYDTQTESIWDLVTLSVHEIVLHNSAFGIHRIDYDNKHYKPIFRNLATDLTREIEHNGKRFIPIDGLKKYVISIDGKDYGLDYKNCRGKKHFYFDGSFLGNNALPFYLYEKLQQWHFWLGDQSFFEKGIILDYKDVNGL